MQWLNQRSWNWRSSWLVISTTGPPACQGLETRIKSQQWASWRQEALGHRQPSLPLNDINYQSPHSPLNLSLQVSGSATYHMVYKQIKTHSAKYLDHFFWDKLQSNNFMFKVSNHKLQKLFIVWNGHYLQLFVVQIQEINTSQSVFLLVKITHKVRADPRLFYSWMQKFGARF